MAKQPSQTKVKKKEKSTLPEGLEEFMSENSNTKDNT